MEALLERNNVDEFLRNINSLRENLRKTYGLCTRIIHDQVDKGNLNIDDYVKTAKKIKIVEEQLGTVNKYFFNGSEFGEIMEVVSCDGESMEEFLEEKESLKSFGHSLTESFLKTKPAGFKLLDEDRVDVKNWKDLYVKTCKMLLERNERLFRSFLDNPKMNWTTIKYFTKYKPITASFVEIAEGVYINTIFGANEFMKMIQKLLEEYKISSEKYRIFLRGE